MGFMSADAADGDGHRRAGAHMMGKKGLVVHQIDMFAGEDQYALLFFLESVVQVSPNWPWRSCVANHRRVRPGRAATCARRRWNGQIPGFADADMIVQATRAVLGEHGYSCGSGG